MTDIQDLRSALESIIANHTTDRHRLLVDIDTDDDTKNLWRQAVDLFGAVRAGVWFAQTDRNLGYAPAELTDYDAAIPLLHNYLNELSELKSKIEAANRRVEARIWWPFFLYEDAPGISQSRGSERRKSPTMSDILIAHLGEEFRPFADEMIDWDPRVLVEQLIMSGDPGDEYGGRCLVEMAKQGDEKGLRIALAWFRK